MNGKRKKIINIYMLISLLFLVFGIELSYYFYNGVGNFLQKIPIDFVNENQIYFSYGILSVIFLGGFISGIVAVRYNVIRKLSIVVMLLNLVAVLAVAVILGLGIYNDYKDAQEAVIEYQEKNVAQAKESDIENEARSGESDLESEEPDTDETVEAEEQPTAEPTPSPKVEVTEAAVTQEAPKDITSPKEETPKESVTQQNSGIHTYSFVCGGNAGTWEDAYKECIQNNAHLVTFETQEEFDYVTEQLTSKEYQDYIFYIGGRRDMNSQQYYWIDKNNNLTGDVLNNVESWTSGCWLTGEPSFRDESLGLEEHVMSMFYKKDIGSWVWNDIPNDLAAAVPAYDGKIGIIYEYEN